MKYILSFFLTLSVLITSLSAAEFGSIKLLYDGGSYGPASTKDSDFVMLSEGDYFEVISYNVRPQPPNNNFENYLHNSAVLRAENESGEIFYNLPFAAGTENNYDLINKNIIIIGPGKVYLYTNYTGRVYSIYLGYKLTRAPNPQPAQASTPAN